VKTREHQILFSRFCFPFPVSVKHTSCVLTFILLTEISSVKEEYDESSSLLEDGESWQENELVTKFKCVQFISTSGPFMLLRCIYIPCVIFSSLCHC
jgi:hypothetical protein